MAVSEKSLPIITSFEQEKEIMESFIKQKAETGERNTLNILEAGCGREWILDLDPVPYSLTGVDLDADALAHRRESVQDLDKGIVGDLRSVELETGQYDVIFNSYVLEHIKQAESVLENFQQWLKPGGLLILQFPDRNSVYGFLTRFTPYWVHVLYLKYLSPWKNEDAGERGHGPYPTFHEPVVSRDGIQDFCKKNNLSIEAEYGSNRYIAESSGLKAALIQSVVRIVHLISFGNLESRYNNLLYVVRKVG